MTDKEIIKTNLDFLIKDNNRLEFENKLLKADYEASEQENAELKTENARLKEIQKRLQDDLKRINKMYFKESDKNYKLSEISLEYNARRCIENLYKDICDDTKSVQETYILMKDRISEFLRIHKVMTLNYDEQKTTYRQTLQEIKEIAELSYQMKLESKDCIICDDYLGQILQKISEVDE